MTPVVSVEEPGVSTLRVLRDATKFGWEWKQLSKGSRLAVSDATWLSGTARYVVHGVSGDRYAPVWVVVVLEALVEKYIHPKMTGALVKVSPDFLSMLLSWCRYGGRDALEGRARPLASVIALATDRLDVANRVAHFINEQGF